MDIFHYSIHFIQSCGFWFYVPIIYNLQNQNIISDIMSEWLKISSEYHEWISKYSSFDNFTTLKGMGEKELL